MKPFAVLVRERMNDPKRAVDETMMRLERWRNLSGSKTVTLDEVAWMGAIFALGGIEAGKQTQETFSEEAKIDNGSRVVSMTATDASTTVDRAGG
jgi:hypothetical protein